MTRFINTTLIGLVAFFLFLAVLWLFVDPAAPGLSTAGRPESDVRVKDIEAEWAEGAQGTTLRLEILLENDGSAAAIQQVAHRATLDGQLLAAATDDPPTAVPAGAQAPVRVTVELPPDFAARWLQSYQERGESAQLRVDGSILVRSATSDVRLPYEWQTSWKGRLLDRLEASPQDCPGPPAPLCLEALDPGFKGGDLQLKVTLRNDRDQPVVVRNGTFRLVFEDVVVASGRLEQPLEIGAGADQPLPALLSFDDGALSSWWGGHVARCETSRLALNIGLEVDGVEEGSALVDWDILAAPFETGFACQRGA